MKIRRANIADLNNIIVMYNSCVAGMIKNGIDQWDNSYPNKEIILQDLECETYYVVEKNNNIIGGFNIDQNQDPTYLAMNWKDNTNSFLVVHRLGIKQEYWGNGIGKKLMLFAEKVVKTRNLSSIRLDTYSGNQKAMVFYKKLGYTELGTIHLKPNKNKYHCFEKVIVQILP